MHRKMKIQECQKADQEGILSDRIEKAKPSEKKVYNRETTYLLVRILLPDWLPRIQTQIQKSIFGGVFPRLKERLFAQLEDVNT